MTDRLCTRGCQGDLKCLLYPHSFESLGHVLCQCPNAKIVLEAAPFNLPTVVTSSFSFKEWLLDRALSMSKRFFKQLLMMLWALQRNRNDKLWFNVAKAYLKLVAQTLSWCNEFVRVNKKPKTTSVKK